MSKLDDLYCERERLQKTIGDYANTIKQIDTWYQEKTNAARSGFFVASDHLKEVEKEIYLERLIRFCNGQPE